MCKKFSLKYLQPVHTAALWCILLASEDRSCEKLWLSGKQEYSCFCEPMPRNIPLVCSLKQWVAISTTGCEREQHAWTHTTLHTIPKPDTSSADNHRTRFQSFLQERFYLLRMNLVWANMYGVNMLWMVSGTVVPGWWYESWQDNTKQFGGILHLWYCRWSETKLGTGKLGLGTRIAGWVLDYQLLETWFIPTLFQSVADGLSNISHHAGQEHKN